MEADDRLYRIIWWWGPFCPTYSTRMIILALMTAPLPNVQRLNHGNKAVQEAAVCIIRIYYPHGGCFNPSHVVFFLKKHKFSNFAKNVDTQKVFVKALLPFWTRSTRPHGSLELGRAKCNGFILVSYYH